MSEEQEILFEVKHGVGFITLNRPKALNALTLGMIREMSLQLSAWQEDSSVKAVAIRGAGDRAFCAGGDVRAVWEAGRRGDPLTADFFREEYRLNRMIHVLAKPYVALIDGITMGGGVGLSVHGSHRVAGDRTMVAMPEVGIGLFPDVGGTYFLPRLPGRLGLFLALTGWRLNPADALYCGVATDYVPSDRRGDLLAAFAELDWSSAQPDTLVDGLIERFKTDPGTSELADHQQLIDHCFSARSVESILAALDDSGDDWAAKVAAIIRKQSPTSLKVTFAQLEKGGELDFDQAMIQEYRMSQAFMAGKDFYEGIRALLVDKDHQPKWEPGRLSEVPAGLVEDHFRPLGERDLTFP
ncbi:enoyl-CoA hydratase/isomerase family protein [Pelagibius sp. CAU 1746]|uniref:enoyl-CoA hydratase/isomerase family protein n=1 Tax=Pelagibius sp. CAU 1746 TaxID=3140370 RepID=UPI00325A7EA8